MTLGLLRFTNASGGTGDWAYPGPTIDMQSPASAQAVNGTTYLIYAESFDKSQWEIATGVYASAGKTFARTAIVANSENTGAKINFSTAPQVHVYDIVSTSGFLAAANNLSDVANAATSFANLIASLSAAQQDSAQQKLGIPAIMRGYIDGLIMSTAGSSTTISVAAGVATDGGATDVMTLASSISKTTSAWAVGTGNGGLDTGTIAASTWYYLWLIKRPDTGVVDVLISLSSTAPTMPTSYTLKRRIGAMKTNASSQWLKFKQVGDDIILATPILDVNGVDPGTAGNSYTLTVPPAFPVLVDLQVDYSNSGGGGRICYIESPLTDLNASGVPGSYMLENQVTNQFVTMRAKLWTNTGQLHAQCNVVAGTNLVYMVTWGWRDPRGANA